MKIGRREERFIHRVAVLTMLAIVMGIGVVVTKESQEMEKLIAPSTARDLLLLLAPFAALATTGYTLAGKMFSSGGLLGEVFGLLGSYSLFLAVALPSFFKRELPSEEACKFWQFFCEEAHSVRDNRISFIFIVLSVVLVTASLWRAGIFWGNSKN